MRPVKKEDRPEAFPGGLSVKMGGEEKFSKEGGAEDGGKAQPVLTRGRPPIVLSSGRENDLP